MPLGELLHRHQRGDWGQVDALERRQNELGLRIGLRLRSAYDIAPVRRGPAPSGLDRFDFGFADPLSTETVWVITSADRQRTTVLLPREIFDETWTSAP